MTLLEGINLLNESHINSEYANYIYKYLDDIEDFDRGIYQLLKGIPPQYVVGHVDFYGYKFMINEHVLIPRFETEELVSKILKYIDEYLDEDIKIVDIGTGSGCIAVTLKKELKSSVDAVDISKSALEVAKKNASLNDVVINFFEGNLLDPLTDKYDVIISNPPYIRFDEEIMDIVKNNEPGSALYAKNNGLYFYEEILKNAGNYLNKKNIIAFEIGCLQGDDIQKIGHLYFPKSTIKIEKDLQGKDRFIFIFNC